MRRSVLAMTFVLLTVYLLVSVAAAETIRWARSQDTLTLDPHAQNEGPTHAFSHHVYEPLMQRDMVGEIIPLLATDWSVTDDPTIWEFQLRQGVLFHDGSEMTADDVVFSLNRAMEPTSDMRGLLTSVADVIKVDDYTVHIQTDGPNPLLPNNLTNLFIMSEAWSRANGVESPQDFTAGEESYAARNAMGTGAYRIVSREPDVRTVMQRHDDYWGNDEFALEVSEIVYTPIQSAATRIAALLSGEVDFVQDLPVQDVARVRANPNLQVISGPENRTIFFGLNVADKEDNPFADIRVREAMHLAINRDAIRQVVMRGQAVPAGVIMPPFVNGWTEELDTLPEVNLDRARELLAEAGYPNGFSTTLHCPNDRYINDEAICQAAVGMLGQIGIRVNLEAQSRSLHFPLIQNNETDFFMLGWGVPTYDSEYIFTFLYHTRDGSYGTWNTLDYSDPEIDAKIQSLSSEIDTEVRNQTIAAIWEEVQSQILYLPIHHQVLDWGLRNDIEFVVQPENQPHLKFMTFKR